MRQNPLTRYGIIIAQGQALMLIGVSGLNLLVRSENTIADIPIIKIRPNKAQPRKVFSEDELSALSRSISENGILQPLTVRKVSSTEYELVAGERRLRAAVMAGLRKVPCIVVKCSDRESAVYALLENLQRADLGIFEEARGIAKLIRRYGLTQEQAAERASRKSADPDRERNRQARGALAYHHGEPQRQTERTPCRHLSQFHPEALAGQGEQ